MAVTQSVGTINNATTTWHYESGEAQAMLRTAELPNGERIDYSRNDGGEQRVAEARIGPAVVRARLDTEGRIMTLTWDGAVP